METQRTPIFTVRFRYSSHPDLQYMACSKLVHLNFSTRWIGFWRSGRLSKVPLHILPTGFSEFLICISSSKQCCLMMCNKQKLNMEEPLRNVLNRVCYDTLPYRQQLLYLSEKLPKWMFKICFNSFA